MPDATHSFAVPEMDCEGCVRAISAAVHEVDGAARLQADLERKSVAIKSAAPAEALALAIRQAGFAIA